MMTMTHNARLAAKVKAQNRANAEANRLQPLLIEAMRPYVGTKILTHDGLAKKIQAILPEMPNRHDLRVYRDNLNYTLRFCVSANDPAGEHSVCYAEASIWVGAIDGYNLASVTEPQQLRTDYTPGEVTQLRANLEASEKAMRDAQSALSPFPRFDQ